MATRKSYIRTRPKRRLSKCTYYIQRNLGATDFTAFGPKVTGQAYLERDCTLVRTVIDLWFANSNVSVANEVECVLEVRPNNVQTITPADNTQKDLQDISDEEIMRFGIHLGQFASGMYELAIGRRTYDIKSMRKLNKGDTLGMSMIPTNANQVAVLGTVTCFFKEV